ncbi:zinc metalloprotease HtpX [Kaarinaea lacus]
MDGELVVKHKLLNVFQSAALVILLSALMTYIAWAIAGEVLAWIAFAAVLFLYFTNPVIAPQFILRMYNATPVTRHDAQSLYHLVNAISERAQLKQPPRIFYIPSRVINAFALGSANDSVVAISEGVLRKLNFEELAAILAHEITHVKNNDIRVMTFADIAGRITKILSLLGQILIFINLPLILFTELQFNWFPLLVMVIAPLISDLLQLGLSRIREYDADLGSAILLGDARPLASALAKMEYYKHNILGGLFVPVQKIPEPSLLRTHPPTRERIKRLLEFAKTRRLEPLKHGYEAYQEELPVRFVTRHADDPRKRITGFWY